MKQAVLVNGNKILASKVVSKLQGPFLCPHCKTKLDVVIPADDKDEKHFLHRGTAYNDCPGEQE